MRASPPLTGALFVVVLSCAPASSAPGAATSGSEDPSSARAGASALGPPSPLEGPFATLDRGCQSAAECVLVQHRQDCCGTLRSIGIAARARAAFDALEAAYEREHPAMCECVGWELDDTGTTYVGSLAVTCLAGTCRTVLLP